MRFLPFAALILLGGPAHAQEQHWNSNDAQHHKVVPVPKERQHGYHREGDTEKNYDKPDEMDRDFHHDYDR